MAVQRLLAALYLSMPHNGIVQGDRFVRGQSGQGFSQDVMDNDKCEAVHLLERARGVSARLAAAPPGADREEIIRAWIGTDFDLATTLT